MNISRLNELQMIADLFERFPHLLHEFKNRPEFEAIERMLVASIANADTVSEGLHAFNAMQALIADWKFVFASESGPLPGLALNRTFTDGSAVRALFSTERVLVLDKVTNAEMLAKKDAVFPIDYSIALDTQALSYLAPHLEGSSTRLPLDFHEVFKFISRDDVNVDPLPYMTENIPNVMSERKQAEIRRRLEAYEVLRTIDSAWLNAKGEVRSTLSPAERNSNVADRLSEMVDIATDPVKLAGSLKDYRWAYCILLKAAAIQLAQPNKAAYRDKITQLVEFMDKDLGTMLARESMIAAHLFEHGQHEFGFFGKIQKGQQNNLKILSGMAWDFAHVRHVESVATRGDWRSQERDVQARYFFSAILTCDKRYVEVLDLYPLKSYAYKPGMNRPVPFPAFDWLEKIAGGEEAQKAFARQYYSRDAIMRRDERRPTNEKALENLVSVLEEEFRKTEITN